jgi:hypothetical protein
MYALVVCTQTDVRHNARYTTFILTHTCAHINRHTHTHTHIPRRVEHILDSELSVRAVVQKQLDEPKHVESTCSEEDDEVLEEPRLMSSV